MCTKKLEKTSFKYRGQMKWKKIYIYLLINESKLQRSIQQKNPEKNIKSCNVNNSI